MNSTCKGSNPPLEQKSSMWIMIQMTIVPFRVGDRVVGLHGYHPLHPP